MNFDEVLSHIGGFGKFQKTLYVWICLPQILLAFHMLVSVFTGAVPPHLCRSTWPPASTPSSHLNFSLVSSPGWDPSLSCTAPLLLQGLQPNYSTDLPPTNSCHGGWDFSKENFQSTVVTEWELVCDNAMLNNIGSSIYMFGLLVGAVLFGALADKYGCRMIILVGLTLQATFGVGAAFAPNFYVYIILRFVVGTTISAVIMNAFVLGTEWTGRKHRMLAGIITDYFFGFGYILLAGVAYLIRDWRKLQLAISAPGFLFIFYVWVLPQSARWLMANKRKTEAMELIRKAAKENGKPLNIDIELCQEHKDLENNVEKNKYTVIDLIRTPKMRRRTLILFYLWFVNVLVYYGLSLNVSDFGTNIYLTQFIFGLVEMPARTITLFTLNRSRRFSMFSFIAIGGVACLFITVIPNELSVLRTILAMVGKFGITASLSIVYVYSAEIFPTIIRQSGIGMSSMCARTGGIIAPIIYLSQSYSKEAPMAVFGLCALLGAGLTLLLPETANTPLPDTIRDVEQGFHSEEDEKKQEVHLHLCPQNSDIIK